MKFNRITNAGNNLIPMSYALSLRFACELLKEKELEFGSF